MIVCPPIVLAALNDEWFSPEIREGVKCWLVFQVVGTFVATLSFHGTMDGTTWVPVAGARLGSAGTAVFTTVQNVVRINATGLKSIRLRLTAYTSGSMTIVPAIAYLGRNDV